MSPPAGTEPEATLSATEAVDGAVLLVNVKVPKGMDGSSLKGVFEKRDLAFYPMPKLGENVYQSVLGVPYGRDPGPATVTLTYGEGETKKTMELKLTTKDGNYPKETIKVSPKHVKLSKKDQARNERERKELGLLYQQVTEKKYWEGPFSLPIDSPITSPFGTKRMFNGQAQSFHVGLDLKAPTGTPILAPAGGIVALAKNLFMTGNTVILDHGYGVFTVYAHMSKMKVAKGDSVVRGQLLGLSGMTGRASGPHLHWGANIHREKVNPLELTKVMQ